jgi:prefoldin subunit 5
MNDIIDKTIVDIEANNVDNVAEDMEELNKVLNPVIEKLNSLIVNLNNSLKKKPIQGGTRSKRRAPAKKHMKIRFIY